MRTGAISTTVLPALSKSRHRERNFCMRRRSVKLKRANARSAAENLHRDDLFGVVSVNDTIDKMGSTGELKAFNRAFKDARKVDPASGISTTSLGANGSFPIGVAPEMPILEQVVQDLQALRLNSTSRPTGRGCRLATPA
jgi:hypothetical protein